MLALALASGTILPCPLPAQGWEGGVKSGITRVRTSSEEFAWNGSSSSALFIRRGFARGLGVQAELAHSRRSGTSNLQSSTLRMVADYVELPVLLHATYRLPALSPFVTVGPTVGLRVRCSLQFLGGGVTTDESCDGSAGAPSHRADVGVTAGGGLAWSIGATTLTVESRVTVGLRRHVLPTDVSDAQSRGWAAYAGIEIPFQRRRGAVAPVPTARMPHVTLSMSPSPLPPGSGQVAPVPQRGPLIRLVADDVNVRDALRSVAERGGLTISLPPRIDVRITAALHDVPPLRAIQAIADVAGLDVVMPSSVDGPVVVTLRSGRSK